MNVNPTLIPLANGHSVVIEPENIEGLSTQRNDVRVITMKSGKQWMVKPTLAELLDKLFHLDKSSVAQPFGPYAESQ